MRLWVLLWFVLCAAPVAANDAVGRVNVAGYNTRTMCSGTLIRPDLVVTAAHCVANPYDGYAFPIEDMVFVAGWDGEGHAGASRAASVAVHPDAFPDGRLDIAHDLALIALKQPIDVPGVQVGSAPPQGPFTLMGYKRSRPHRLAVENGCAGSELGALWRITCGVEKGQSGGPVIYGEGEARRIVAVLVGRRPGEGLAVPVDRWLRRAIAETR